MSDLQKLANDYDRMREKIKSSLGWSDDKVDAWFLTNNPHLGEAAPFKMITMGRAEKLEKIIDSMLRGDGP